MKLELFHKLLISRNYEDESKYTKPELGTLEWITFNPNYLIQIFTVETFNFSP